MGSKLRKGIDVDILAAVLQPSEYRKCIKSPWTVKVAKHPKVRSFDEVTKRAGLCPIWTLGVGEILG